jgi:hypothetical protein
VITNRIKNVKDKRQIFENIITLAVIASDKMDEHKDDEILDIEFSRYLKSIHAYIASFFWEE